MEFGFEATRREAAAERPAHGFELRFAWRPGARAMAATATDGGDRRPGEEPSGEEPPGDDACAARREGGAEDCGTAAAAGS